MGNGFWDRGYAQVDDLIDPRQVEFVRAAMEFHFRHGRMRANSGPATGPGHEEYAPVASEALLRSCLTKIEAVVERALLPAYSFWRVYETGSVLARHSDRNSCEISATLMIHAEPAGVEWPIRVRDLAGAERVVPLRAGSAIVYLGRRVQHWREPFSGLRQFQVFLHYVQQDGEFAEYAFDKRAGLNC